VYFAFVVGPQSGIRKGESIYEVKPNVEAGRRIINEENEIDGESSYLFVDYETSDFGGSQLSKISSFSDSLSSVESHDAIESQYLLHCLVMVTCYSYTFYITF
jgi:hypothetical protein